MPDVDRPIGHGTGTNSSSRTSGGAGKLAAVPSSQTVWAIAHACWRAYLVLGHAISGRQLAHDLFRRVLLPRSQVDVRVFRPATWAARLSKNRGLVVHVPIADPPDPEGRIGITAADPCLTNSPTRLTASTGTQ